MLKLFFILLNHLKLSFNLILLNILNILLTYQMWGSYLRHYKQVKFYYTYFLDFYPTKLICLIIKIKENNTLH